LDSIYCLTVKRPTFSGRDGCSCSGSSANGLDLVKKRERCSSMVRQGMLMKLSKIVSCLLIVVRRKRGRRVDCVCGSACLSSWLKVSSCEFVKEEDESGTGRKYLLGRLLCVE
jgi:hypothetical protein